MITLYHYVHCPFCVRVRMALGLLKLSYKSEVIPYDDEKTPLNLTGVKMLPIANVNGSVMNESLDIIKKCDEKNVLKMELLDHSEKRQELEDLLNAIGSDVHSLAMPYWIYTKEFNEQSRKYFQSKKELKRGPFNDLMKKAPEFISGLNKTLAGLESKLNPFYNSNELTIFDIMIASHLWGMYVVPEFQFSEKVHTYLQTVKEKTQFHYHEDFYNGNLGN